METYRAKFIINMTSISESVYINKLDGIDNKYKNAYQRNIKLNPTDVKSMTDIDFVKKNKKEDPEFNVGNHVRILKYENVFAKCYVPIWFEEVFVIKKLKILFGGHLLLAILMVNKFLKVLRKKIQKTNQKEIRIEKVIKRKGDKLCAKGKGYDNSFNRWIDEKDIVI